MNSLPGLGAQAGPKPKTESQPLIAKSFKSYFVRHAHCPFRNYAIALWRRFYIAVMTYTMRTKHAIVFALKKFEEHNIWSQTTITAGQLSRIKSWPSSTSCLGPLHVPHKLGGGPFSKVLGVF
jgi:hypothetical protein